MSSNPSQNAGMDIPTSENILLMLSGILFLLTAESIPRPTPDVIAIIMERITNSKVAGKYVLRSLDTGFCVLNAIPKSQ